MSRFASLTVASLLLAGVATGTARAQDPPSSDPGPWAIEVRFEGNSGLSAVRLRDSLEPWLEDLAADPDDPGVREDLVYEVGAIYRKSGYPRSAATIVEVEPESDATTGGALRVLEVRIVEGPRAYLEQILITGNRVFGDSFLEGTFPWPRLGLLPGGRPIYTDGARDGGVAAIELVYSLQGYLSAEVTTRQDIREVVAGTGGAEPVEGAESSGASDEILVKLIVEIVEGPRTTLGRIEVRPGSDLDDATLIAMTAVRVGSPVTPRLPVEVRSRVRRALQDRGHYLAKVRVEMQDLEGNRRALRLSVDEGPVHTFGDVVVRGNPRTRNSFIRNRLGIEFGETYSATALEDGQRILNSTGLLSRFSVDLVPAEDDPQRLNVIVDVRERDAIRFETRVGFSTYELGRFGAGVLHRNLFGYGIEGRLDGLVSFKGEELEARLRYPFLFESDVSIELRGKYRRFEEVSFERQESLGTIQLEFPVDRRLSLNTGFEARDEDISQIDPQVDTIDESSRAHLLFVGGRHDDRDSAIATTEGLLFGGRFEYSDEWLGSDLDFLRLTLRSSYTHPLGPNWGVVLAAQTGLIDRTDEGDVPLGERFFLGGARSVRSFRQDRMGPRDEFGNEIGGEAFLVGSVEFRRKLFGSISGAAFLDAGSLVEDVADYASHNWRFGSGLGMIWNSPVGPLRIDAAVTLNPEGEDDEWAVHILLGQPF